MGTQERVLVRAEDFLPDEHVDPPIPCSNGLCHKPRWHIISVLKNGFFVIQCANKDTFRANQIYVPKEAIQ